MRRFYRDIFRNALIVATIVSSSCLLSCSRKPSELLTKLKEGGYVIYFRHAQTIRDYADQADPKMRLNDCNTQRKLSSIGIQQAKEIGASFKRNNIPINQVISSDYCRSWKTAKLAFGQYNKNSKLNFLPFEEYTSDQVKEMRSNLNPFLSAKPPKGKNTVIVGHDDLFEAATGIYPKPQGIAYVVLPYGNGSYKVLGKILPNEWKDFP